MTITAGSYLRYQKRSDRKDNQMTRNDIKAIFPDADEEKLTALLNQFHKELDAEAEKAKQFKVDADKVTALQKEVEAAKAKQSEIDKLKQEKAEIQKQLDTINDQNLTESEKAQKERERIEAEYQKQLDANNAKIAELEAEMKKAETMKQLAERGITGEDADNFFNEDGSLNFDTLGKVLSERETAARNDEVQKIAKNSTNPGGSSAGGKSEDEKPADVENAESLSFGNISEDALKARDYYK